MVFFGCLASCATSRLLSRCRFLRRTPASGLSTVLLGKHKSRTGPCQDKQNKKSCKEPSILDPNQFFTSCNLVFAAFASTDSG